MRSSYDWSYTVATPYEILGIPANASDAEIKAAWRQLTQVAHPDRGGTSALFVLTQEAYELLHDPIRRRDFDQSHGTAVSDTSPTESASNTDYEAHWREEEESETREPQSTPASSTKSATPTVKPAKLSVSWLLLFIVNIVVSTHYGAIVAANERGVTSASQSSFMIVKPWRSSVAALTFLRGDLWVPYASMLFLAIATLLYLLKDLNRAPSWFRRHYRVVRRTAFFFGLAISLPMLVTGILWGFSIAVTLAIIALAIFVVIAVLSVA